MLVGTFIRLGVNGTCGWTQGACACVVGFDFCWTLVLMIKFQKQILWQWVNTDYNIPPELSSNRSLVCWIENDASIVWLKITNDITDLKQHWQPSVFAETTFDVLLFVQKHLPPVWHCPKANPMQINLHSIFIICAQYFLMTLINPHSVANNVENHIKCNIIKNNYISNMIAGTKIQQKQRKHYAS